MRLFLASAGLCLAMTVSCTVSPCSLVRVQALDKILHTDTVFEECRDTIEVARGENAVVQLVFCSEMPAGNLELRVSATGLGEISSGWVHDVLNTSSAAGADDLITTPDNMYPDPIFDDFEEGLDSCGHKTLITDVFIPRDARPGIYRIRVKVLGTVGGRRIRTSRTVPVRVYPVTLPEEQSLKVVNWYTPVALNYLDGHPEIPMEVPSRRYLDLLKLVAEAGAKYGQNCWLIRENPQVTLNEDSTDFVLDFTDFDRTVQMLIEHGNLKYLCLPHIGDHAPGVPWTEAMMFNIITVQDKRIVRDFVPHTDPRLEPFLYKYFSQWEAHVQEKGWTHFCYQHVADEPDYKGTPSQQSWSYVAGIVKKAAPSFRIIDASYEIVENQDVSVVVLGENISSMPAIPEGSERWMYTCCIPQGNFANRYVQQPLLKTRVIHWLNFKYNECGYLHWGFNYWNYSNGNDPIHDATPCYGWPGGDCFVAYPGNGKIYPSIRLLAMRDGIRDYELLKMVESKDAAMARKLCDEMVYGPDSYNCETAHFLNLRHRILKYLAE